MKNFLYTSLFFLALNINAQLIDYELYTLDNGLDVILHQENSSPVVTVSVMYLSGLKMKLMVELDLHIFLNIYFLKEQRILKGVNGLILFPLTVVQIMLTPRMTELITTKHSHQTALS